jgi:LPXTG-motif cell wall-anchored protein
VVGAAGLYIGLREARRRTPDHRGLGAIAAITAISILTIVAGGGTSATAAIVPTVPLATAAEYAVLGASTVTNTGDSVLDGSLGLWPGTSITGFPPGLVLAPGTIENTSSAAQQAQSDLTVAYDDAAGRPLDATTPADLVDLVLVGGVYAGPSKSPLLLSGPLVLDGAGDPTSVFIFQTDSTLTTASSSTVTLINGAQECNVFWQVGSSATLGTSSVFAGNILALTSITVTRGVTVHGRALARNAAVTLDNDTFIQPTCATAGPVTTTVPGGSVAPTVPTVPGGTITPGPATTPPPGAGTTLPGTATTVPGSPGTAVGETSTTGLVPDTGGASTSPAPTFPGVTLPRTGSSAATASTLLVGLGAVALGAIAVGLARRRPAHQR